MDVGREAHVDRIEVRDPTERLDALAGGQVRGSFAVRTAYFAQMNVDATEFAKFFGEDLASSRWPSVLGTTPALRVALRCAGDERRNRARRFFFLAGERVVGERGGGVDGGVGLS